MRIFLPFSVPSFLIYSFLQIFIQTGRVVGLWSHRLDFTILNHWHCSCFSPIWLFYSRLDRFILTPPPQSPPPKPTKKQNSTQTLLNPMLLFVSSFRNLWWKSGSRDLRMLNSQHFNSALVTAIYIPSELICHIVNFILKILKIEENIELLSKDGTVSQGNDLSACTVFLYYWPVHPLYPVGERLLDF